MDAASVVAIRLHRQNHGSFYNPRVNWTRAGITVGKISQGEQK